MVVANTAERALGIGDVNADPGYCGRDSFRVPLGIHTEIHEEDIDAKTQALAESIYLELSAMGFAVTNNGIASKIKDIEGKEVVIMIAISDGAAHREYCLVNPDSAEERTQAFDHFSDRNLKVTRMLSAIYNPNTHTAEIFTYSNGNN